MANWKDQADGSFVRPQVYLAAPWVHRDRMEEHAAFFETNGVDITHKWWHYEGVGEEHEKAEFLRECAHQDLVGVLSADAVIVFNTAKSEGKATEQGIALGAGVPIIIIGTLGEFSSNVFHYLETVTWVKDRTEALKTLMEGVGGNRE